MRRLTTISLLGVVILGAQDDPAKYLAAIAGPQSPNRQGMDPLSIDQMMDRFRVTAVSIAVIHNFKIHLVHAWGFADVAKQVPATTGTMFQAASISKPVAAMASLKAVQEKRFTLDQDINSILKSWKLVSNFPGLVTPRTLMSHTSGTGDGFGFPGFAPGATLPTLPQILDGQPPSPLGPVRIVRPPLTAMQYSGGAVTIQQLALTDTYNESFAPLMQRLVLDPIGMKDSTFEQPLPVTRQPAAAHAHNGAGKTMEHPWHVYPEGAAAGLWTTPTDLARFALEVQMTLAGRSGKVLDKQTMQELITPVGVGGYAVGFSIGQRGQGWYFSHSGANWG